MNSKAYSCNLWRTLLCTNMKPVNFADKDMGELETARAEVKEECGYDVPHANIRQIQSFPGSVGISGERMTM